MLELYVIRHGLAGSSLEDETKDQERPLKKKGRGKIKEIAKGMKERGISFDTMVTSPLLRAKETAEIIHELCGETKEILVTPFLKPDASFVELIAFLNQLKERKRVAIVGHEPFLSGFATYCLTKKKKPILSLKKGGVLMMNVDEAIKAGECMLAWLMEPNQIIKKS